MRTLAHVIAHVRAQNRPGSHGAVLVAEVDRLRRIVDTVIPAAGGFDPDNFDQVDALAMAWCERFHAMKQEVDRLRAWIAAMSAEHPSMSRAALAGEPPPTQETANV